MVASCAGLTSQELTRPKPSRRATVIRADFDNPHFETASVVFLRAVKLRHQLPVALVA